MSLIKLLSPLTMKHAHPITVPGDSQVDPEALRAGRQDQPDSSLQTWDTPLESPKVELWCDSTSVGSTDYYPEVIANCIIIQRCQERKLKEGAGTCRQSDCSVWETSRSVFALAIGNLNTKGRVNWIRLHLEASSCKRLGNLWLHLMALTCVCF